MTHFKKNSEKTCIFLLSARKIYAIFSLLWNPSFKTFSKLAKRSEASRRTPCVDTEWISCSSLPGFKNPSGNSLRLSSNLSSQKIFAPSWPSVRRRFTQGRASAVHNLQCVRFFDTEFKERFFHAIPCKPSTHPDPFDLCPMF